MADSERGEEGRIPCTDGEPAFSFREAIPSPIPVLIAVPHAGRTYPATVRRAMRHHEQACLRLEDRLVDLVGDRVSSSTGASLLVAHAPRAMIDLNRSTAEMDWGMVREGRPGPDSPAGANRRVRGGLGLVPRRLAGLGELWLAKLGVGELTARIDSIHRPYHQALAAKLSQMRDRWGAALLIDLHSMPPLDRAYGGAKPPLVVLGDRFGASCHSDLLRRASHYFAERNVPVSHNRPYAGGYVLDRHADPAFGIHALQLEICRTLYLDSSLCEIAEGLESTADILAGLVRHLAAEVSALGCSGKWAQAAE